MTNHVHLLLSGHDAGGVGGMMKALGQRYVQHVNRVYARSGTLWEGRYRSCLVQHDLYLLVRVGVEEVSKEKPAGRERGGLRGETGRG